MTQSFVISARERLATGNACYTEAKGVSRGEKKLGECVEFLINMLFQQTCIFSRCRYECPAGCLDAKAKVVGTVYYEMVRAAFGVSA